MNFPVCIGGKFDQLSDHQPVRKDSAHGLSNEIHCPFLITSLSVRFSSDKCDFKQESVQIVITAKKNAQDIQFAMQQCLPNVYRVVYYFRVRLFSISAGIVVVTPRGLVDLKKRTVSILSPEDGGCIVPRNVSVCLQVLRGLQPKRHLTTRRTSNLKRLREIFLILCCRCSRSM